MSRGINMRHDNITCPPEKKKAYKKMLHKYKKLLKKDAKGINPFDYGLGLEMFIDFLKFMQEYYELGYNVWAMERKDEDPKNNANIPTRAESLKETIQAYNLWKHADEYFTKIVKTEQERDYYIKMGYHLQPPSSSITTTINEDYYYLTSFADLHQNTEAINEAQINYKHKFFECLEKYLEEWWD